jgi:hypothetical protein
MVKAYYAFVTTLLLLSIYGWAANLYKLILSIDDPVTAMFIARIVGLFAAPLGIVLGYF